MIRFKTCLILSCMLMLEGANAGSCTGTPYTCSGMPGPAGKTAGSCYDQCYADTSTKMLGKEQVPGDACDESKCCTDPNGMKPKASSGTPVHKEWYIDPRYYLQRTQDPEADAYWHYNFHAKCRCSSRGWSQCGSSVGQDQGPWNDRNLYRNFFWDQRAVAPNGEAAWTPGALNTQGHPNDLTHSSCITISKPWGLVTVKIGTDERDKQHSQKMAGNTLIAGDRYTGAGGDNGAPYGPMNIPPVKVEVDMLYHDGTIRGHETSDFEFSFEIKASKICPSARTIAMFDSPTGPNGGSYDPLYHYDPTADGIRPYEPLMPNPTIGVGNGEYFFVSNEDTPKTAGFYFPEFQWNGRQMPTNDLIGNDCYVHYRIVTENSCDPGEISHSRFGNTNGKNIPHPDFTKYHNNEYPWKDNSAILFDYDVTKHWFIPNVIEQNTAHAEYYFHILAEDNFIPDPAAGPDVTTTHNQHGTRFCSPRITLHVCGLQSSKLRKWDSTVDPVKAAYPKDYTYCSVNPPTYTTNGNAHKFPILDMENTNAHCAVDSKYWPGTRSSDCGGAVTSTDGNSQVVISNVNPTAGSPTDTTVVPPVQNGNYYWKINENTRTMTTEFYILIKAEGAESKMQQDCDPTKHTITIKCCPGSATISIPKLGDTDESSPNEGWQQHQRLRVLDTHENAVRRYKFRKPESTNPYCKDIYTTVAMTNALPSTVKQTYMKTLVPTAYLTNSYDVQVLDAQRFHPHTMNFYITAQQQAYGIDMDSYVTPSQYSLELFCDTASTHYTNTPTLMPTTASELPDVVYKMIEPDNTYTMGGQFAVSNTNCPRHNQAIVEHAGKAARDYKSTDAVTPVTITSALNDPNVVLNVPSIQELTRDFYFQVRSYASGLSAANDRTQDTPDIRVRRVNCYYTTIQPFTEAVSQTFEVKDIGDTTPHVFEFTRLNSDHVDCNRITFKSSQTPSYPGTRQTKLDETALPQTAPNKLGWTVQDTHHPDDFDFYLVAQEDRLAQYISPELNVKLVCGLGSTHFINTESGTEVPGPPKILPFRDGFDKLGVPYDFYEMINPETHYRIPQFNVSNSAGCPLIKLEIVPTDLAGSSPADYLNNDKNASVEIISTVTDPFVNMTIPNITTHTHWYNFRIKATALGGKTIWSDNIKIKKVNCDVSAVTQDPKWPQLDIRYEEKQVYTYSKNIQYLANATFPDARNASVDYPAAFILNTPECPIRHFRITAVLHHQFNSSMADWRSKISIDDNAFIKWHQLYTPQDKFFFHVQASAGLEKRVWSNHTIPIGSFEVTEIPYIFNEPPYFSEIMNNSLFHFGDGVFDKTWNLWQIKDPEGRPVTVEIMEGFDPRWMQFDNDTRQLKFSPQNEPDFGPHKMVFKLTDADGQRSKLYTWEYCICKPSLYDHWDIGRQCAQPRFQPWMDVDGYDADKDYSCNIDYCKMEQHPWSQEDIKFAQGLSAVYLPCGSEVDENGKEQKNKGCDKILSDATGITITESCCHEYVVSDAAVYTKPKCQASNAILEKVKEIYGTIDNLGWNAGDESSFCYHPAWMKRHPKYFDAEREKMLFTANLQQKHIDLPTGKCVKDIDTKKGINCDLDETDNFLGPGMCRDGNDCRGHRDCNPNGFCQGEHGCDESFCKWIEADPSEEDWQCYLNRYDDLRELLGPKNVTGAKQHYNDIGRSEGRDKTCGQCEVRLNPRDGQGRTKLDEKLGCIQQETEAGCLDLKSKQKQVNKYGQIVEAKTCNVKPLETMKLIANSQECGDGGRLRAGQYTFQTVQNLKECEQLCVNQLGCEWFDYEKSDDNVLKCYLKKEGCENSKKSKLGSWSYRPSGYLSKDCIIEPEQEFVDNYISLVREDVCQRREAKGLPCIPKQKRRLDLNITRITPQKKMHIEYSEKLLSFDKYFKELGLNRTQLSLIGNTVLNLTYYCKQLPYNSSQLENDGAGRNKRRARNLLIENDWMEEPDEPEEIVPDLNNWFLTKFTSEEIIIDLNFTHTSLVSAYYELDYMGVTVLKNGFFSAFEDYQFLEPNYTLQARPIPPLCSDEDIYCGSSIGLLIGWLVMLSLFLPLLLMSCINLGMGRVWSLYFMLQLITNLDNFEILKQPASTKEFLQFLEEISNFKVTAISWVKKFYTYEEGKGNNWLFKEKEMVQSIILYGLVLMTTFGIWKNWPKSKSVKSFKKLLIWSPIFRCIMMTWFATGLWTMTWFNASTGGYDYAYHADPVGLRTIGKRMLDQTDLQGLASRYPTQMYPESDDGHRKYAGLDMNQPISYFMGIMPLVKVFLLVFFPIAAYIWIKKNYDRLSQSEFHIKFSTLYTDMIHKPTAQDVIILLCGRRALIVFVTVFLNRFHLPMVYFYLYGSIFLLQYYISKRPFNTQWAYWLELLNETHVMVAAYFSFFFTEWISNIKARYQFSNFFVDLTVWVIILNQLGIFYETYLGVRRWNRKRELRNRWRAYLRYKEELVLLLMEYWRYFGINKKQNNFDLLMMWSVHDIELKIKEMRELKEREMEVVQVVPVKATPPPPPPPPAPAPAPIQVVQPPPPAPKPILKPVVKAKIISFASFMDKEPSKKIEMIQNEKEEIKAKVKRTNFAEFMDYNPKAVAGKVPEIKEVKDTPLAEPATSSRRGNNIGIFQTKMIKTKQHIPTSSRIIIEEEEVDDSTQNNSRNIEIVNVYENKGQTTKKSNLTAVRRVDVNVENVENVADETIITSKQKKPTFGDYMDHLQSKDVDVVDPEEEDTYDNGTFRIEAIRNQRLNENLIDENAALDLYTQKILHQAQDRVYARQQEIVHLDNSGRDFDHSNHKQKEIDINRFVGDDSAHKNLIRFSESQEHGQNEILGADTFEHVGTGEGKKKSSTKKKLKDKVKKAKMVANFASFMDEIPNQESSQHQDKE